MDALTSSVSTLKVPNFNLKPRGLCYLKTPNRQTQLHPHCSQSHTAKRTTFSDKSPYHLSNHKNPTTTHDPFFSSNYASAVPFNSSPYVYHYQKPATGYAAALLDLAQCNGSLDTVRKDVHKLSILLRNGGHQVQALLSDPFVSNKEKGKVVKELGRKGKFNKQLIRLLKIVIERSNVGKSMEMVSGVLEEFERIYDELSCESTQVVWISSENKIGEDRLFRIAKRVQENSGAVKVNLRNLVKDKLKIPV